MTDALHPSVRRVLGEHGDGLLDLLADRMSGADLTSLLLAVAERRSLRRTPAEIVTQYGRDRFVGPATVPPDNLRRVATTAARVASEFDEIELAPLAPLGLHAVLGGISQNRVVPTARSTEVAADPTTLLALEAARRRATRDEDVRLSAVQRVTRTQAAIGAMTFAHFTIFGLVTAGRDRGDHRFERDAMVSHVIVHCDLATQLGLGPVRVALSDLSGERAEPLTWISAGIADAGHEVTQWSDRREGIGYYPSLCFKVHATAPDGTEIEFADGGVTAWTQELLQNRKERLMTSGAGLDRLALLSPRMGNTPGD